MNVAPPVLILLWILIVNTREMVESIRLELLGTHISHRGDSANVQFALVRYQIYLLSKLFAHLTKILPLNSLLTGYILNRKLWFFQADTLTVECKRKDCPQLDCPRELQVMPDEPGEACCKVWNPLDECIKIFQLYFIGEMVAKNVLIYMGYNLLLAKRKDTKSIIKKEITWSIIIDL